MEIVLSWNGPFGAGRIPGDGHRLEAMMEAGVYLRVRRYGTRTVSYVGQSRNLLARMDQHLSALLGLQYPLRDGRGVVRMAGDAPARLAAYNDISAAAALAAEEARRMDFFLAICGAGFPEDRLNLVEGAIKNRLESRLGTGGREVENRQGIPADPDAHLVKIRSEFGALDDPERAVLADILGRDPVAVPHAMAGDGSDG